MNEYWGRKFGIIKNGERIIPQMKNKGKGSNSTPKPLSIGKLLAQQAIRKGWLNGKKIRNV